MRERLISIVVERCQRSADAVKFKTASGKNWIHVCSLADIPVF